MKMLKQFWKVRKDDNGFSLVELDIAIAVLAVLVGIVGVNVVPQYDNSKKATDAQYLSALVSETMEAWIRVDYATNDMKFKVTVDASDHSLIIMEDPEGGREAKAVYDMLLELAGAEDDAGGKTNRKMSSAAGRRMEDVYIFCDTSWGVYISPEAITSEDAGVTPIPGFEGYEFQSR